MSGSDYMDITNLNIQTNDFKNLIESVALKGKYVNGDSNKNGQLSNYALVTIEDEYVNAYNADSTTICSSRVVRDIELNNYSPNNVPFILEIEKTVKYLKGFKGVVQLNIGDYITITSENGDSVGKVPLVTAHPHHEYLNRVISFTNEIRSDTPSWGEGLPIFGQTQFEAEIVISENEMRRASEGCDVVNLARYKFDYNNNILNMSSSKSINETYETTIEYTIAEGDSATVEFSGQFAKFLNGAVRLYLKDDSPILFVTPHRLLLKAPYINR